MKKYVHNMHCSQERRIPRFTDLYFISENVLEASPCVPCQWGRGWTGSAGAEPPANEYSASHLEVMLPLPANEFSASRLEVMFATTSERILRLTFRGNVCNYQRTNTPPHI